MTTWALPEGAIARLGRGSAHDIAFSPNGQYLAVASSIGLWLYQLPTLSPLALWDTERGMIDGVTFSPDSHRIVTSTFVESVKIWDIERGVCIAEANDHGSRYISVPIFSADGQRFAAANSDGKNKKIYVWGSTGRKIKETEIQPAYDVSPLCFSPDLDMVVGKKSDETNIGRNVGDGDSIVLWDVETGEQIINIIGYPERVRQFCFSLCGGFLTASDWHGKIHVWNIENGDLETTYTDYEGAMVFQHYTREDGLIAAAVSERKVEIWGVEKSEKLDEFGYRGNSIRAHFSENGEQLAIQGQSDIHIWTKGSSPNAHALSTLYEHIGTMDTLVFSADEKTLAAGFWRDNVLLWDVASRGSYRPSGEKLPATSHNVYAAPHGKIISIKTYGNNLNVQEVGKPESLSEFTGPEGGLGRAKAFSPTGHRIASADKNSNIHIWERASPLNNLEEKGSWKKRTTLVNHAGLLEGLVHSPSGMAFSPDGTRLVSISRAADCKVCLWNVDSGKKITELAITPSESYAYRDSDTGVAFSPRGDLIACGTCDEIVLWSATEGTTLMALPESEGRPITLCFSPCGNYLASGAWWQPGLQKVPIRLWEVETGKHIVTFWGHTTDVQAVAFSPNNARLVSASFDGSILLWDLRPHL